MSPAPVQVSLPGYPCTTGLETVGYRITDFQADPPGLTEHLHTEQLVRMPGVFTCYSPPSAPDVAPLPARKNGFVTFGVFNAWYKVTDKMIGTWAALLREVPQSRLLIHHYLPAGAGASAEFRSRTEGRLRSFGVDPARLILAGPLPRYAHLDLVTAADIALDTFPYNGMTTTCDCLWMGVPVVALEGRAHLSRVGVSYLTAVGLEDWVASSPEAYVATARRKAQDLGALEQLRGGLRNRLSRSALMDAEGYTRRLEDAYRWMWRRWCAA